MQTFEAPVVSAANVRRLCRLVLVCCLLRAGTTIAQQALLADAPQPQIQSHQPDLAQNGDEGGYGKHHIFWVIPNYRSEENGNEIKLLTPGQKFKLAFDDSFDPTAFLVAGVFAGTSMAQNQYSSFGQGAPGFGKYYGGAFADQAIGNFMTKRKTKKAGRSRFPSCNACPRLTLFDQRPSGREG